MTPEFNPYVFIIISVVELILKGLAMWRASKENQLYWFVAILVLNTFGILPAIYLFLYYRKYKKI